MQTTLTPEAADRFARIALGHVTREYPNHLAHTLAGPEDAGGTPQALHPVFYGSYDWHSCVHAYWMLARLLRRCPGMPAAGDIRALFDRQLVPDRLAGERAYFERPTARGFERPYGWAWLLKLAAELGRAVSPAWGEALAPLAALIADRFRDFLPKATYPVRAGTHFNTAFALTLAADQAEASGNAPLLDLLRATARRWYGADAAYAAPEPSGDDFLSPALVEAACMRRLLPAAEFVGWLGAFLPDLAARKPATLFVPATVTDRSDGKIAHLDGLNLSRAWCWRRLAAALPAGDPRAAVAREAADLHLAAGLPHVAGHYMGEHWLATYAVLALDPDA